MILSETLKGINCKNLQIEFIEINENDAIFKDNITGELFFFPLNWEQIITDLLMMKIKETRSIYAKRTSTITIDNQGH